MIKKVSMILRKVTEYLGIEELIYVNVNEEEELSNKEKDVYTQKKNKKTKMSFIHKKEQVYPTKKGELYGKRNKKGIRLYTP